MQKRLEYIDTCKGLLILFVIFGHIGWYLMDCCGITNSVLTTQRFYTWHIITPFYMCAFFVIRGLCAQWNKSPKQLFISDVVNIMIPMLLFSIYHDAWFCYAMLFASLFYQMLKQRVQYKPLLILISFFVSILGVVLHRYSFNWSYISFALPFVIFLSLGDLLSQNESFNKFSKSISWLYIPLVIITVVCGYNLPFITGAYFNTTFSTFPIFVGGGI